GRGSANKTETEVEAMPWEDEEDKTGTFVPSDSGRKVYIRTFGCQMNERDSEVIAGMLIEKGYEIVDAADKADVILFNTCSVRQHAEDRVAGNLRQLASRKKKDPGLRIGVLGCMAKRHGENMFRDFPQVDMVVGPGNMFEIPDLVPKIYGSEKILAVKNDKLPRKKVSTGYMQEGSFSAYVNIMSGCDNFCSYCIVPYVRGREVSRSVGEIVSEIKYLADRGVKEVTLLGQNVNSYGKGLSSRKTFPDLLEAVNGIKGLKRVRFTTSHPKDADKSLFRAMRDLEKVCEYLHLPLQAGSDKILDLMNRKYTYCEYRKKIDLLRSMMPDAGLSTDIIVGFPSEKNADYRATRKALEEIQYNSAFIFKYSPRTPSFAATLVDDVTDEIKKKRNNELLEIQKEISSAKNRAMIGTEQEVLVEGRSRMSQDEVVGKTRNNTSCVFRGGEDLVGSAVRVLVRDASSFTLKAEMVSAGLFPSGEQYTVICPGGAGLKARQRRRRHRRARVKRAARRYSAV
ncbi:MAG: tRNA (N6-isopentenyl adenosine(37)-C2)-methylthiotransferase MiaB, partial [Candidatus Omnitrophota bacterium]